MVISIEIVMGISKMMALLTASTELVAKVAGLVVISSDCTKVGNMSMEDIPPSNQSWTPAQFAGLG
jgi:hypothetical protein